MGEFPPLLGHIWHLAGTLHTRAAFLAWCLFGAVNVDQGLNFNLETTEIQRETYLSCS